MNAFVKAHWIKSVATGIVQRDGSALAQCVDDAVGEQGRHLLAVGPAQLAAFSGPLVGAAVAWLRESLHEAVEHIASTLPHARLIGQVDMYVEFFTRVASTVLSASVVRVQQASTSSKGPLQSSSEQTSSVDGSVLLRGFLHAFEALSSAHMDQRRATLYDGFPGWDTVLVITAVHLVQEYARSGTGVDEQTLGDIVRSWRRLFVYLQSADADAPNERSRRRGTLAVVNGLLIILFQNDNTHQCTTILRSIEQSERIAESTNEPLKSVIKPSGHLVAEQIKFRYYRGRIQLYDRAYAAAFVSFMDAYKLLPTLPKAANEAQRDNKLRVHFYLLTAATLCGFEISDAYIAVDALSGHAFAALGEAMKRGSPAAFSLLLDLFAVLFRRRGVWLLLQQARIFCYLNLLQQVHAAMAAQGVENSLIPVPLLVEALSATNHACCDDDSPSSIITKCCAESSEASSGLKEAKKLRVEVDAEHETDDVTLWLARLVAKGMVNGYVSVEHKMLVLSKRDPFPLRSAPLDVSTAL